MQELNMLLLLSKKVLISQCRMNAADKQYALRSVTLLQPGYPEEQIQ